MKHTSLVRTACASLLLVSAAPLVVAQNPASSPSAAGQGQGASPPATAPAPRAELTDEQASYLFGLTLGESLHGLGLGSQLQTDPVTKGVKDALAGKKSTPAERQQVQEYARMAMQTASTRNKTAAEEFLAKNGKEKGVQTTASGLQYKIVKAGDTKAPTIAPTDEVTVNYRGKLIDGTEFDSSYSRGQPTSFPVNGVIKGWQEALVMMKPGASWQLFVPPDLAYGPNPRPNIPGNSLLIFDVDVISAKPGKAATPPPTGPKTTPPGSTN
jgi:FKBP-type peptidyl-prolyl cis-trans isomerase FklB